MEYSYSYDVTRDGPIPLIISLVVLLIMIIAVWKIFVKAGRPGILAIIPFVNTWQLVKISGNGIGIFILLLIPFLNIIALFIVSFGLAKNFGKSGLFAFFGLIVFSFIGYLILGFGKAQYIGGDKAVTA